MDATFLTLGVRAPEYALTLNRIALGTFDRADWVGDVLYLPEALYCIGLAIVMLAGPGPWSVDATLAALFAA